MQTASVQMRAAHDRAVFLDTRRTGIGGSDIGAILGIHKFKTPAHVWLDKTGAVPHDDEESEAAYWGKQLEAVVATEYHRRTGNRVQRINSVIRHADRPWMIANIDRAVVAEGSRARIDKAGRLAGIQGVLECKTGSAYTAEQWNQTDAPLAYVAQCQWYMSVTGAEWCDLGVLIGGQQYRCIRIDRDDNIIASLVEVAAKFWCENVLGNVPPVAMSSAEALALFPDQKQVEMVTATLDDLNNVKALRSVNHQTALLDDEADRLQAAIKQRIGESAGLVDTSGKVLVTWKQAKASNKTDWRQVAEDLRQWAVAIGRPEYLDDISRIINDNTYAAAGSRRLLIKD